MKNIRRKPAKVRATLSITKEAQDIMLDNGYASARTMGDFISKLIVEYHNRHTRRLTTTEIAAELRELAALLEDISSTE